MDFGYRYSDVDAFGMDGTIDRNMDVLLSDANKSDPEIIELAEHLEGRGFKLVRSRESKARLKLKLATCSCSEASNAVTGQ